MDLNLAKLRKNYTQASLEEDQVSKSPFSQFQLWLEDAINAKISEPNAMTLATVDAEGIPSARTVLLKHWDENGFCFFTNYQSTKGKNIERNAAVAVVFPWIDLERQIIIKGTADKISREDSEKYFHMRPYGSQIGAWASDQSQVIPNKLFLEEKDAALREKYPETEVVPLPDFWGGYRIIPKSIEFWQGGAGRLHDRIFYELKNDSWKITRLSP